MYTAEEWAARERQFADSSSSHGGGGGKSKSSGKPKPQSGGKPVSNSGGAGGSGGSNGKKKGKCHYCGKTGHRKKDCWSWLEKQKEHRKKKHANLVRDNGDEHDQGLFMAVVINASTPE